MRRLLAACAALLLLVGCSSTSGQAPGGDDTDQGAIGFTVGDGTVTIVPPESRVEAPVLEGPSLADDAKQLSTEQYAGRIVVVNVWGSWCAPCRHEAPALVDADERLGEDVQLLGLNTRDLTTTPAQAFVRRFGITYPNIFDPDGALLLGFGQLPPKAIPSTIVIDAEGRVAARVIGEVDANTLVGIVEDVS
ncbi:TlpA disulfide reductase family protein [uncultured Tessaracoccus sp.]|uniref:TlpA family protein disulfide reductase n=1 Tax=uncultured Tessaracoccus sp. TaxID=905023 RepID=UPI0025EA1555|nr:TlpA disulfide reductase family protein [uncultured Tessaracoccus sp.]